MAVGGFLDKVRRYGGRIKQGLGKAYGFAQHAKKMGEAFLRKHPGIHGLASHYFKRLEDSHPNLAGVIRQGGKLIDGDFAGTARKAGNKMLQITDKSNHPVLKKLKEGADVFHKASGKSAADAFGDAVGKATGQFKNKGDKRLRLQKTMRR